MSKIQYLTAEEEEDKTIAQANAKVDSKGNFLNNRIKARQMGDFPVLEPAELDYMDVAPNQIASISASLIPFLEHDDANRALMGSNMMRQSVPLIVDESPIVGTGLEFNVANDARICVKSEGDGVVTYADKTKIIIDYKLSDEEKLVQFNGSEITYDLSTFKKTNQNTCFNLKPIVSEGDKVTKVKSTSGYCTDHIELALGKNLKVAFMPGRL